MLQAKFYHCFVTDEIEAWGSSVNKAQDHFTNKC